MTDSIAADRILDMPSRTDPTPSLPHRTASVSERLDGLHGAVEALSKQVDELVALKKLVAWAVPMLAASTVSFIVTASVAFYKIDAVTADYHEHSRQSALVAHPGTADALWGIRQDLQATRATLEAAERERGIRHATDEARMERIERQSEQALQLLRARR